MKTLLPILLAFLPCLPCPARTGLTGVSTNKAFIIGTNNTLNSGETNFFATNLAQLTNALNLGSPLTNVAGGGGGGSPPSLNATQFASGGGTSNIIAGVALTNINAVGISNTGPLVVTGSQTNSNTFRIYQGNFSDLMDWYGTGGSAAYLDHLANFTTLGNITAGAYNDNQGFHSDGTGDVFANNATVKTNIYAGTNEYLGGTNFPNYEVVSNNVTAGGQFIGLNTGLTNAAGQTILSAQTSSNQAQGTAITNYALANFAHAMNGHTTNQALQTPMTTNLTETATLTASNIVVPPSAAQLEVGDGFADMFYVNLGVNGWVGMTNSGYASGGNPSSVFLDAGGNVNLYPNSGASPGYVLLTNGGYFRYNQKANSGFYLYAQTGYAATYPELIDEMPNSFALPLYDDLHVASGASNNSNFRVQADATLNSGGIRYNITNISGQSTYSPNMFCTIIECNPTAASCTVTLPTETTQGLVTPSPTQQNRPWTAQNGYADNPLGGGLGNPIMPAWTTMEYFVDNLGSNTGNTLTVVLPWAATNIGGTSIIIPNQMEGWFKCTGTNGTNISVRLLPLSFSPTYSNLTVTGTLAGNGAGVTNLQLNTNGFTYPSGTMGLTNGSGGGLAVSTNGYWTNQFPKTIEFNAVATNGGVSSVSPAIYIWTATGRLLGYHVGGAENSTQTQLTLTALLGPGDYVSFSNFDAGIAWNIQTNWVRIFP